MTNFNLGRRNNDGAPSCEINLRNRKAETTARTCKWPVSGEGFSMLFCGGHFNGPGSYCAEHRKRAVWPRICEGAR